MEFKKFTSLENTYRQQLINKIVECGLSDGMWHVSEKIDGSNYSFQTDGVDIKPARRTSFIESDEKFYNHRPVFAKYKQAVLDMHQKFCTEGDKLEVFGELYGNGVQRKVYYKEDQDFAAFEIYINNVPVSCTEFYDMCTAVGIPTTYNFGYFTFEEALSLPNVFETRMSDKSDPENIAEGVVIKPVTPKFLPNGSRIILKNKNDKFSEKNKAPKVKAVNPIENASEEVKELLVTLTQYITDNRLDAVISKIGIITKKDFGKLQGLFVKDILEDYEKDTNTDIKFSFKDEYKLINKELAKQCVTTVRDKFVQVVE